MIMYPVSGVQGGGPGMHDTIIIALNKNTDWLPKVDDFTYCPGYNNWKAHKKIPLLYTCGVL